MATRPVTTWDVLDGHVTLDLQCLDRIYLNGYLPNLQVGGQIVQFLAGQGFPIPSPAVVARIGDRFRDAVRRLADAEHIPVVRFAKHARKLDVMRPHLDRQAATGRSGIAAIGVAQEFQWVASSSIRPARGAGAPHFEWGRAERRVSCFYFYLWDEEFGPAFVKICSYLPYPIKIWLNGHEWAKQQAARAGIGFTALANGFASTDDPAGLQAICDRLGPADIQAFADRWWPRLPLPLTGADREHGYWWELSMRQIEVSRTMVFDQPRNGRAFFETLVADNLDLGRPEKVELIFGRRIPKKRSDDRRLRYPGRHQGCRCHHRRPVQAFPRQAVLQVGPGVADRNGDQRPDRPRSSPPDRPSGRTCRQSPCREPQVVGC